MTASLDLLLTQTEPDLLTAWLSDESFTLTSIAKEYRVSTTVMARRLKELGITERHIKRRSHLAQLGDAIHNEKRCSCGNVIFPTISSMKRYGCMTKAYYFNIYADIGGRCVECHNQRVLLNIPPDEIIRSSWLRMSDRGLVCDPLAHFAGSAD